MSLDYLMKLVRPPRHPVCTGTAEEWMAAEERLGTRFPDDYRALVAVYGNGTFGAYVNLGSPFTRWPGTDLFSDLAAWKRQLTEWHAMGHPVPFMGFVEADRLIPWAETKDGDGLLWIAQGPPRDWSVLVRPRHEEAWHVYDMTATCFLWGLLSGRISLPSFPDFTDNAVGFERQVEPTEEQLQELDDQRRGRTD